jgi:hypothetical protein
MNTILYVIILVVFCYLIFRRIRDRMLLKTVTGPNRGTRSERKLVIKLLRLGIPAETIFHDLYVRKYKDNYSQIDLVVVTEVGILVFEVKDYSGWIYGNGSTKWTQVLAYGRQKYQFYNPIMQNNKHIAELKKQFGQFESIPFYSIIVFYGDCVLKEFGYVSYGNFIIKDRSISQLMKEILTKSEPAIYTDKNNILRLLKDAAINGDNEDVRTRHVKNIRELLERY